MNIVANLNTIRQRIQAAETKYHRPAGSVLLLAVSKTQGTKHLQALIEAKQYNWGENYLQEALRKISAINVPELTWHFIGPIQSNKTRKIAHHFHWVHSVSRKLIAEHLNSFRPPNLPPLQICIQVNMSGNPKKSGITLEALPDFANTLLQYDKLCLRGLMTIPDRIESFDEQRAIYQQLREAKETLNQKKGFNLDTLSMGMSHDLEAAIAEGATIVRIGSAIFGPRKENEKAKSK